MKRLIVCCDGTWNTPEQEENNIPAPTNVVRFFNAVAEHDGAGNVQEKYYHPGVGTEGSFLVHTAGGVYGEGLDKNIKSAYSWLAAHYQAGDAIYLVGFSRGAYTVRSLGGLIGRCGLPILTDLAPEEAWSRIESAYQQGYQEGADAWRRPEWLWHSTDALTIDFIGVWDTVGARGIPDDLSLLNVFDDPEKWRFYDTRLGPQVKRARHALAMDEMRASFTPTLWTDAHDQPIYDDASGRVQQLWFPGVHSDVGGGYSATGLSDIALQWMIEEASVTGLAFARNFLQQLRPDPQGTLHDSIRGVFKALRTRPRNLPNLDAGVYFHPSALQRLANPPITQAPYRSSRKLDIGQEIAIPVYAIQHWNWTGIYLEMGASYELRASGAWLDKTIACGPEGAQDGKFELGEIAYLAGSILGKFESLFQKVSGNQKADFIATRRIESLPWFCLVGVIANDGVTGDSNPAADGSPSPHQYLPIGVGPYPLSRVQKGGYLYAFANDAWHFYDNNRGHVTLWVKRTG
jgi:uncharacterized protein (DUF2235 family)